jgi:hypothetical protein
MYDPNPLREIANHIRFYLPRLVNAVERWVELMEDLRDNEPDPTSADEGRGL